MLNINSTVRINQSAVNSINKNNLKAFRMTADAFKTDVQTSQRMPFKTGALQNDLFVDDSRISSGKISICSSEDYSLRVYMHPEFNFNKTHNALAQAQWFDYWIKGAKRNFCRDTFIEFSRQLNGLGGV